MTSPTQRALAELKKRGWPAAITEHWNQYAHIRQDLFGVFDLLAIRPAQFGKEETGPTMHTPEFQAGISWTNQVLERAAILGIQVTSAANRAARRDKLQAWAHLKAWRTAGGEVELWTFGKQGGRGKRKLWTLTVEQITCTP